MLRRTRTIQSVDRALDILELLASHEPAMGVTQLASQLGLNVSTVHHLLKTLQRRQFVSQSPNSRLYSLGTRCLYVGQAYLAKVDLYTVSLPHIKQAARSCGETVSLVTFDDRDFIPVVSISGIHAVRSHMTLANRHNAHANAMGKVYLASLSSDELRDHLQEIGLAPFTANTITTHERLEAELERVRRQDFAIDQEELEIGLCGVSAPIRNHVDDVIGALSCSVPSIRFTRSQRANLIALICTTAQQISECLGCRVHRADDISLPRQQPIGSEESLAGTVE